MLPLLGVLQDYCKRCMPEADLSDFVPESEQSKHEAQNRERYCQETSIALAKATAGSVTTDVWLLKETLHYR